MSRRTRVPKFGSWDSSEGTQFTEVFEDARLSKAKSPIPPPPRSRPASIDAAENETRKPHSRRSSKENAEAFAADAPARRQIEPPAQRIQIDNTRYVPPPKSSSENTRRVGHHEPDDSNSQQHKSPIHHHSRQAASRAAGNGSPSWERRPSTEGSATPGRSRLRNSSSNADPAEKAAPLPKFGAWDANDPASGDGFTMIFNNARNEKKAGGSAHVPPLGFDGRNDKDLYPGRSAVPNSKPSSKLFCCFQPTVMEA